MIEVRFRDLVALDLELNPSPPGTPAGRLPIPVYMDEMDEAMTVLNEIEREHRRDVERNIRPSMPSADASTWKKGWESRVAGMMPRELYRTVAYLVYATTLGGVARTVYADLIEKLARVDTAAADAIRANHEARIQLFKADLEPATRVRNKVFAHTSFASPTRPDDTLSMRVTSLQYLIGNPHGWGCEGLVFGGNITFGNEPQPGLAPMGVSNLARNSATLFAGWHALLADATRVLIAFPDTEIMKADSRTVRVIRRTPPTKP